MNMDERGECGVCVWGGGGGGVKVEKGNGGGQITYMMRNSCEEEQRVREKPMSRVNVHTYVTEEHLNYIPKIRINCCYFLYMYVRTHM